MGGLDYSGSEIARFAMIWRHIIAYLFAHVNRIKASE
jgi:hypothetical protein